MRVSFHLRNFARSDMMADMKRHPNWKLNAIIRRHKLSKKLIAELCQCGRTSVYCWTRPIDHKDFVKMSSAHLRLLQLELGEVEPYIYRDLAA